MVAMPNMSRPSLEHHDNRINMMARNNPEQEAFIRSRYQSARYEQKTKHNFDNYYDSQDEVDLSDFGRGSGRYVSTTVRRETIIRRIVTSIVSTFYTSWYNLTKVFRRSDNTDLYYTQIETESGIFLFFIILSGIKQLRFY